MVSSFFSALLSNPPICFLILYLKSITTPPRPKDPKIYSYVFVGPFTVTVISRIVLSIMAFFCLFGFANWVNHHVRYMQLLPIYIYWTAIIVCFYILSFALVYLLFRALKLHHVGFYFFFVTFQMVFLLLPIADVIFSVTAGQKLTPNTIRAYSHSSSGGNPISLIIDSYHIARSYSPEKTKILFTALVISLAVIVLSHYISLSLVKHFPVTEKVFIWIFYILVSLSLVVVLFPSSISLRQSQHPSHTATKPADAYFLFPEPPYPIKHYLKDLKLLREFFPLPKDRYWISDFSRWFMEILKNTRNQTTIEEDFERPDIFLILWETLSGNIVSAVDNPVVDDATPNLKKFFEEYGVLYHELVTNACPTANSFWSLFNLGLPLSHGNTIVDTLGTNVDSLYSLINRSPANYSTLYTSAANPNFDGKDKWLDKNEIDDVFFRYDNIPEAQNYDLPIAKRFASIWNNDRILVDQVRERTDFIANISNNAPLFNWITSISTHNPFSTFDDPEVVGSPWPDVVRDRYLRAINYSDKYLVDEMLKYLKSRDKPNTVVIFMGDHAAYKLADLVPKCPKCPQAPFDNDQVFYTTAVLGYLGDEEMRKKLKIPKAGTKDYRAASALDIMATIAELTGAGDDVTYSMGRSLLDDSIDDSHRKSLSLLSLGAELGLADSIVRTDWSGSTRLQTSRPHPTFLEPTNITKDTVWFEMILRVNLVYNHIVTKNRLWHNDFLLNPVDFPQVSVPIPDIVEHTNLVLLYVSLFIFACILLSLFIRMIVLTLMILKRLFLTVLFRKEKPEEFLSLV
ncbi:hypothetical protein GEMRC1_002280 [Eukaryota sp. GEM-RC1]